MRIGFLATAINVEAGGGSHRNAVATIRALREAGHSVDVHTFFFSRNAPPGDIVPEGEDQEGRSFLELERHIAETMKKKESRVDLFFVYGHALLWGAGAYRARGSKPVAVYLDSYLDSMHESMRTRALFSRFKHLLWERTVGRSRIVAIDRFIAVSDFLRNVYIQAGFPKERFTVVPNFFEWKEPPLESRDSSLLLYVGRLVPEKGIDTLLDALPLLPHELPWTLRIVGDGPMRSMVEKKASQDARIKVDSWMGEDDLARVYARSAIFVHPARWAEPFGRTIVEAMHAGLPVVVPEYGAGVDIANDAGVTFKNGDPVSLARAIARLLDQRESVGELARRATNRSALYAKHTIVPLFLRTIEDLVLPKT